MKYNPNKIERKWQNIWYSSTIFKAKDFLRKEKFYILDEFPYPSGDGLHVGHCRPYIGMDVIARKRRMQGFNVLFPMGWDAFGLPTENFAIKKRVHPAVITKKHTANFKRQMNLLGLSFDWSREINTTDPKYYKWTQWIFIKLFEAGLAYKDKMSINWCPSCKIGLANEEVVDGKCERCGTKVEKREKEQWLIKITEYAERLIDDLNMVDYPERVKVQQREWIGKSHGALVKFKLEGFEEHIDVFTTRIDTIFSGTFLILAPGHKFIEKYIGKIENKEEVAEYVNNAKNISDIERSNVEKEVTGVELKGIMVRNPATNEEMPVWVADFVLEAYGTGTVFANAHDKRDFKLAKKYGIPLRTSVMPHDEELARKVRNLEECYEGEGALYNSMQFDGLESTDARVKIISWLKSKGSADHKTSYKLRDWIFSRQHYWGEPIPMIYCAKCARLPAGQGWVPVPEKDLPVELPKVKKYQPTNTGESPLAKITKWVNVKCPNCKGEAKRETDTMPNWAGSNWYYIRYADPKNNREMASPKKIKYWLGVDWYNGGMEHTTLHLLYSRFIFKFLFDIEAIPMDVGSEPYQRRTSHGIILGSGGVKMSKSKGNVINPDNVVAQYGADTLRLYEMFIGPFEQMISWDQKGIIGPRRFIEKVYNLSNKKSLAKKSNERLKILLNKTIKKVSEDIDLMKFNTAVSSMMEFTNEWSRLQSSDKVVNSRRNRNNRGSTMKSGQVSEDGLDKNDLQKLLIIFSPFAPHLSEELWSRLQNNRGSSTKSGQSSGFKGLCSQQKWPKYNEKLIREEKVLLVIQVNGKVRDRIEIKTGASQKEAEKISFKNEKIRSFVGRKKPKKVIFVPDKLINIVI